MLFISFVTMPQNADANVLVTFTRRPDDDDDDDDDASRRRVLGCPGRKPVGSARPTGGGHDSIHRAHFLFAACFDAGDGREDD